MVRNYISNNIDLVQPTQYPLSKSRVAKKPPPAPGPLPSFEPLPILVFWQNDWLPTYAASWLMRTEHSSEDAFINARDIYIN